MLDDGTFLKMALVQDVQAPPRFRIGMVVHSDMILLDLACPLTVFNLLQAEVSLLAASREPVTTDIGLPVRPTLTFGEAPSVFDVLFVPGGLKGSIAAMQDAAVLDFLASRGPQAGLVTSVCTGSLVLAAAGLLRGYQATSHWYVRDLLPLMGAVTRTDRVVQDRNRLTAGGATAGLDFGLAIVAQLAGADAARRIQLVLEYDPHPPFDAGVPARAGAALTQEVLNRRAPVIAAARQAAQNAARRLGL